MSPPNFVISYSFHFHYHSFILTFLQDEQSCCCSVVSNSLQPHRLQRPRLPCPLLPPAVCSNSCSLRWWCYLTISSSAALFSFCLQFLPASGSFPMSRFFTSGDQSIGASASHPLASVFFTTMPPGKPKMKALVGQSCPTLCDPVDCSLPRSSGYSFPSPRDLPDPGIKPRSPALQADSLLSEPPGKPLNSIDIFFFF